MRRQRTHIILPTALIAEIDRLVGKRRRSSFLTQLATQEIRRLRLLRALEHPAPAWKAEDRPELKAGSAAWIRKWRRRDDRRFRKRTGR